MRSPRRTASTEGQPSLEDSNIKYKDQCHNTFDDGNLSSYQHSYCWFANKREAWVAFLLLLGVCWKTGLDKFLQLS